MKSSIQSKYPYLRIENDPDKLDMYKKMGLLVIPEREEVLRKGSVYEGYEANGLDDFIETINEILMFDHLGYKFNPVIFLKTLADAFIETFFFEKSFEGYSYYDWPGTDEEVIEIKCSDSIIIIALNVFQIVAIPYSLMCYEGEDRTYEGDWKDYHNKVKILGDIEK